MADLTTFVLVSVRSVTLFRFGSVRFSVVQFSFTFGSSSRLFQFRCGFSWCFGLQFPCFRMYPKHHLFIHVTEQQICLSGNPRLHWCYGDESEIGIAVRISNALHPSFLHRSVIEKLRIDVEWIHASNFNCFNISNCKPVIYANTVWAECYLMFVMFECNSNVRDSQKCN